VTSVKFTEDLDKVQTPATHFFAVASSSSIGLPYWIFQRV